MRMASAVGALAVAPLLYVAQCAPPPSTPACQVSLYVSGVNEYAREADGCTNLSNSTYKVRAVQVCDSGASRVSAYQSWDWTPFTVTAGCPRGGTASYGHELALR